MEKELSGLTPSPIKICILYTIIAGLWILLSDYAVSALFTDPRMIRWVASLKGLLFIFATACVLFRLMHRHCSVIDDSKSSLRKVSRALRTLRGCDQALVRAEDEHGLMEEVCRMIVEIGGYRLAWVGFAERDEQKTIQPVAQWGYEKDYLEKLILSWADTESGRGPTAMAIRTGVPCVVQNIMTNPENTFWRAEALGHNFASTVSLPLSDEDGTFGALGIYAEEPDAFDTEELDLLKELADDLSYGIRTLRLKAQRELGEKERMLLATACEQLKEGVAVLDNEGAIQYLNLTLERISGYDRKTVTGGNVRELGKNPDTGKIFACMADAMARHTAWSGRFTAGVGRNGSSFEIEMSVSPLRDNAGTITNYVFVSRDVSQEERLEKQLRQSQKMEALGTLAGGIAHDFNNILGAIISCTEFALEDAPEGSPTREDLEHVLKASYRGKNLIKQILTFSRRGEQERQPVQIGPLIKECLKFLRASLPASMEIRQNISAESGMILADPTQIHQVIMNLCTNAAHAMRDKGGLLDVSLSEVNVDPSAEYARDGVTGPCMRLAVADTGHGMDQKTLERIFDPFFTTKKRGEGTGLGLSVVHGIVTNHGGGIHVYSEPGRGTTFEVFLPLIERSGELPEARNGTAVPRGTERIMFVDDEEDLVYAGRKVLKRLGYDPVVFQNSMEALEAFRAHPDQFDMIITDQSMPHMTGAELAREALHIRPGIPIILCSGFSPDTGESFARQEAREIGIREVLMKPFGNVELAGVIRTILDEEASQKSN
ncbi:MAG: ATP-binding protein [Syntrophobacter sp.]